MPWLKIGLHMDGPAEIMKSDVADKFIWYIFHLCLDKNFSLWVHFNFSWMFFWNRQLLERFSRSRPTMNDLVWLVGG